MFQKQHRIVAAYRSPQQAVRVQRVGWINDHHARRMRKNALTGLRMINRATRQIPPVATRITVRSRKTFRWSASESAAVRSRNCCIADQM